MATTIRGIVFKTLRKEIQIDPIGMIDCGRPAKTASAVIYRSTRRCVAVARGGIRLFFMFLPVFPIDPRGASPLGDEAGGSENRKSIVYLFVLGAPLSRR